jgi:Zn-dependent protease with chaperone function
MRLLASSVILGLAWFAAVNVAATIVLLAARLKADRLAAGSHRRASVLLALRLLPFVLAVFVTGALFLPGHFMLEPESPFARGERVGGLLLVLAAAGAALVIRSASRAMKLLRAVSPIQTAPAKGVAIVDGAELPGISLAGIFRPRVLIGRGVREALTPAELDVAIAHELAHDRANDNLTRLILYTAPDLFGATGAGRRLEAQWSAEAEYDADAGAACGDSSRAAVLASALVKVARLGGRQRAGQVIWSTFHEPGLLEARVRRLVSGVQPPAPASPYRAALSGTIVAAATAWLFGVPEEIHHATEILIRLLP